MTTYLQHPLSAAFPGMTEADHAALTADIEQHGQRDPITLHDGMVLDGWHRYSSSLEISVEPRFTDLPDGVDPVAFVKSHNLHRRHLTGSQRAEAVTACSEWAGIGSNQHGGCAPGSQATTATEMAKEADVSLRTIQHAKAARVAGLGEHVRDGEITAKQGAAIAKLPEDQRAAAVKNPAMLKTLTRPKGVQVSVDLEAEPMTPPVEILDAAGENLRRLEALLDPERTVVVRLDQPGFEPSPKRPREHVTYPTIEVPRHELESLKAAKIERDGLLVVVAELQSAAAAVVERDTEEADNRLAAALAKAAQADAFREQVASLRKHLGTVQTEKRGLEAQVKALTLKVADLERSK